MHFLQCKLCWGELKIKTEVLKILQQIKRLFEIESQTKTLGDD